MTQISIPLDQLRFGHEATPPINVRKFGRDADIESLAASLAAHGLGQALNVKEIDGVLYVADGNRRLAALRQNAAAGLIGEDVPVRCEQLDNTGDELSLALNIERVPMHEADQYEKFAELRSAGLSETDIAERFGIEPRRVRRILALGRLHPDILDAWRQGELGPAAADAVRAFTLAPSQKAQKEVFERLASKGQLAAHWIREAFGAGNRDAGRLLTIVGRETYRAAGGRLTEDLFGDDHVIADHELLQELAEQRIEDELAALTEDGWSWAERADDLPTSWQWTWEKIQNTPAKATREEAAELKKIKKVLGKADRWSFSDEQREADQRRQEIEDSQLARSFTAEDKARSGVALSIDYGGRLTFYRGFIKPNPKPTAKEVAAEASDAGPGISNAMMQRLSAQLTAAAADAIVAHPRTALAAVVAGLAVSGGYGNPIQVKAEGMLRETRQVQPFETLFGTLLTKTTDELLMALAHEARLMVNLQVFSSADAPLESPRRSALVEAMEPASLQRALRERFDAADYFKTVPRALTVAAITEALGDDEGRRVGKLKKGPLVEFAVANVPATGWLPQELRTSTYAGPGSKAAA